MKKRLWKMTGILLAAVMLVSGCGTMKSGAKPNADQTAAASGSTAQAAETQTNTASGKSGDSTQVTADAPKQESTSSGAAEAKGLAAPADEAVGEAAGRESNSASTPAGPYEYEILDAAEGLAAEEDVYWEDEGFVYDEFNTEEYNSIKENGFRSVLTSPLSTFAADVDTASYANLRRMLSWGYSLEDIPSGAVRAEEMINYFSYDYKGPEEGEPFGVNAQIADCPWNPENKLLVLGLQTEAIDLSEAPDSNIVFLIDVSGSMDEPDKLPLLKQAFSMLVGQLGEKDRVSIVTYASANEIVLEGVSGDQDDRIIEAINRLEAYGSTNGGAGIVSAYRLAEDNFIDGGNNRVIIASDGDFNVGVTSQSELYDLIREEKEKGIFLSVLGFGYGNYSDANMETLADNGNGNYSYIDSEKEAKKVLVEELGANLVTAAKDVKLQIEFNPAFVSEYRQIGYENRSMAAEDFDDDAKDGGEIGAGHSVTVLYELVPANKEASEGKGLKYQDQNINENAKESGEWLTLSIRYKEPDGNQSRLLEYPIADANYTTEPTEDFRFAASVAEFAMYLTGSDYLASGSLRHVKDTLDELDLSDEYKNEFADLVYMVR